MKRINDLGPCGVKYHYCSYKINMKKTGGTQTLDALEFLPTKYKMPKTSSRDKIIAALEE